MNTIRETVDVYLEWHQGVRSSNWQRDNGYVLRRWAEEMDTMASKLSDITTPILQAWFNTKLKTLKVQTAAAYLYQVQTFLKWCMEEAQLVTSNAALKVRVPKHTKNVRRRSLSLPDAQRLLDNCQDQELKFALYFSIHAGARYIECVMARPEWFNVKNRLIHIMASDDWMPKNKKNRVIPMSTEFAGFLKSYMANRSRGQDFMIVPTKLKAARQRYRFDFSKGFERLIKEQGIVCSYHDLRRTFASLKVSAGVSLLKVSSWCGHRTSVCEESYAHLIPMDDQIDVGLERQGATQT
jgi:integrase